MSKRCHFVITRTWGERVVCSRPNGHEGDHSAEIVYTHAEYSALVADLATARTERDRYATALQKINEIRNSIVGCQNFGFSEHAYPLVAALDEAGYVGLPYPEAQANVGMLFEQRDTARAQLRAAIEALRALAELVHRFGNKIGHPSDFESCPNADCVEARAVLAAHPRPEQA